MDLAEMGAITEEVSFGAAPDHSFSFSLKASDSCSELDAQFVQGTISVVIPRSAVQEMVQTDLVGVHHKKPLIGGGSLSILVEKDFKCLTPRAEDADAFPHPNVGHESC